MTLKSIEHEWQGFAGMVFRGLKPTEVQVQEMKKAFFAGAWALFCAVQEIGEPHVAEQDGEAYLDARQTELFDFYKKLMQEYSERN